VSHRRKFTPGTARWIREKFTREVACFGIRFHLAQVVRSDHATKSSINVVRLSLCSMRLRFGSLVLCVAAMTLPAAAFGQSRETLGEGDSIRITVFQNPDLTTETRISERGTITFPLVGTISLAGLTPAGAEARIAEQLIKGKFVLKPQVSLNVIRVRSRQVSVLGQVAHPGRYALDDTSSSLTDILALAGGVGPAGDDNVTVMITRNGKTTKQEINVPTMYRTGDLSRNLQLENGDTIFVQRAPVFYIYGEVQRAGSYRLEQAMTVMQALSVGGGVTPRGTDRGLKIRRKMQDGKFESIDVRLTDPVQPDDVIYVRESLF
jgi:polysaccharide biosynthesis/export protein